MILTVVVIAIYKTTVQLGNAHGQLPVSCFISPRRCFLCISAVPFQVLPSPWSAHLGCKARLTLIKQVCSDPTPRLFITAQGEMVSLLLCAARQNRFTSGLCHYNSPMKICCSYSSAVTQHQQQQCTAALVLPKCPPHSSGLLFKTGWQQARVTAITPMKMCCSYTWAVPHHQCTAALVLAKCTPYSSGLQNRLAAGR